MSDKTKPFTPPPPKVVKSKRVSSVGTASSSRSRVPPSTAKERNPSSKMKINKNTTMLFDGDTTMMRPEGPMPNFDAEHRQIAYAKFMRAMLEECLIDEKIEREETEMDVQMLHLAERFNKTMALLDKTSRRIKDVSFVVEQKRLLDLKDQDSNYFYEKTDNSNAQDLLQDLSAAEKCHLDKLETRNVDFGFDKDSGHKQLLDAVNEAIEGLDQIKKHSHLDLSKFQEYEKTKNTLDSLEKDKMNLDSLKVDFEKKFPKFSEKLLKEVAEKIATAFDDDADDD